MIRARGGHAWDETRRRPVQGHAGQPPRTAGHGEQQPPGAPQRHHLRLGSYPPRLKIPRGREQGPDHPPSCVQPPRARAAEPNYLTSNVRLDLSKKNHVMLLRMPY